MAECNIMPYALDAKLLALKYKTGYDIVQENGQRIMGPAPNWRGPPPPKGSEIFIGKLPRYVFEDELFPLFERAGSIYQLRLMMDFSCSNRGYAFVTYFSKAEAQKAIEILHGYEIRPGRKIGVLMSLDNNRLRIRGIRADKSKEEIFAEISKYTSGVIDVVVYNCFINKTEKIVFVEYESHRAASMARKILIPGHQKLFDTVVRVDWAIPEPEIDEEHMQSVSTLHASNIPLHINEGHLLHLFSFQGLLSVYRIKKLKDFAFIHYCSRHDAEVALNKLNGLNLHGSFLKISWARPNFMQSLQHNKMYNGVQPKSYSYNGVEHKIKQNSQYEKSSFLNSPVQILSRICEENGWKQPTYQVIHTSSSADDAETTFTAQVYIPDLPQPVKCFTFPETFFSPKDAKYHAAEYLIRSLSGFNHFQAPSNVVVSNQQNLVPSTVSSIPIANSIWSSDISSSLSSEFSDDSDDILNLLASAVQLANAELQSKQY